MMSKIANVCSILSFPISFLGFIFVIWQLIRAKSSLKAATQAAKATLEQISDVVGIATIENIKRRSSGIYQLTRSRSYKEAASAAYELRESVAKFKLTKAGIMIQNAGRWDEMSNEILTIHLTLERGNEIGKTGVKEVIEKISNINERFSEFAAIIENRLGEQNANSERVSRNM
ncbi:MAG: hypothetical protein JXR49_09515 [Acidobacteria bacterium]|nr:hypothetical protein [Acidobacteriota bacterium]